MNKQVNNKNKANCSLYQGNLFPNKYSWGVKDKMDRWAKPLGHPKKEDGIQRISKKMILASTGVTSAETPRDSATVHMKTTGQN